MTNNCPICDGSDLVVFFEQVNVPIFQNKVYATQAQAHAAPTGKVRLTQCNFCSFVFNSNFENDLMVYDKNYHNEQGYSTYFKDHLNVMLNKLLGYNVDDKKVVEIGCGKGYFLELLWAQGVDALGFDPTYEGSSERVIKDYFSSKYSDLKAEVIVLRHTLEHIPNVFDFITQIANANQNKGYILIEVPTFDWILKKQAFWDVFYEHCNYFTETTLSQMFGECETGAVFGGQYIYLWGNLNSLKTKITPVKDFKYQSLSFEKILEKWRTVLTQADGEVAVWGAAAKGSTFLNLLDKDRKYVKYVIDINPAKQNKYIAGTGHAIYSPDTIKLNPVDKILVMNENYLNEITQTVDNRNINILSI